MNATTATYYRTGKGTKRHASSICANSRRRIHTGDAVVCTAAEVAKMAPCKFCCTTDEVAQAAAQAPAKPAGCNNSGVQIKNSRRLYNKCSDCGRQGRVVASTGRLKAHQPA